MKRPPLCAATRRRSPRMAVEQLEDRAVPAAVTFVNEDWHLFLDADGDGTLTVGDIVTNANDSGPLFGAIYGTTAFGTVTTGPGITGPTSLAGFATINDAIAATDPGGTVNVLEGTYSEATIIIDKPLSLVGANAGIHPTVGTSTTEAVGIRGPESILIPTAVDAISPRAEDITIDGFRFEGTNKRALRSVNEDSDRLQFTNNVIATTDNTADSIQIQNGSHVDWEIDFNLFQFTGSSSAFQPEGATPIFDGLLIANNLFNGGGDAVFQATPAFLSGVEIVENEFDGTVGGVPGVSSGLNMGRAGDISIRDNFFHDLLFTGFQVGITGGEVLRNTFERIQPFPGFGANAFELWGGEFNTTVSSDVLIANNIVNYNDVAGAAEPTHGLRLRPPESGSGIDASTITVFDNAFFNGGVRGDAFAIRHFGNQSTAVNASGNWWDLIDETVINALMVGPVDFTPFLASGTDTSPAPGFQGDFSTLFVTSLGDQTVLVGRIQEGFDLVTSGTVIVNAGTYIEDVVVPAGDTLAGNATINGTLTVSAGAALSPGLSPGIISSGDLALPAGSTFVVELNGPNPGIGYDQLNVTGTVTLGGNLIVTGGFAAAPGTTLVLINNVGTDAVVGTFAGLPEGSVFAAGGTQYTLSYVGGDGNDVTVTALTPPVPPPPPPPPVPVPPAGQLFAVGADAGANGHVKVFNPDGSLRFSFFAFEGFNGGVRVATGDVNRDGTEDIVVGAGPGAPGGHVKVFDGQTGALIASFFAFEGFTGGVTVAVGDIDGDGDIVVGTGTGASHVKAFDFATGGLIASFLAFEGFTGGIAVASGNFNGTGADELVVGTASGASHVKVFDASQNLFASFLVNGNSAAGVNVAAGDVLNGDNLAELLVAPATGDGVVQVFSGGTAAPAGSFDPGFGDDANGLRVAVGDANGDTAADILVGPGPGVNAVVRAFAPPSMTLINSFTVFDGFFGGLFVG